MGQKIIGENLEIMKNFDLKHIPDLDVCVLGALELFGETEIPKIKIHYKRPLVVGSGNAEATGRIIFKDYDAVFASESNFESKLKNIKSIDGVVLISASGGKHGPGIVKKAKEYGKRVSLITCNSNSLAERLLEKKKDEIYVFPKQREPYTYNTSTYMGMILGKTGEDVGKTKKFIEGKVDRINLPDFRKYKKYVLIVPSRFEEIVKMLNVKFIELFGREIARDVVSFEYAKHATTIIPSEKELFISFGEKNNVYGRDKLFIPLSKRADYGEMMAVGYYIIGKIQRAQPDWFKKNVESYTKKMSKVFGQKINAIVE